MNSGHPKGLLTGKSSARTAVRQLIRLRPHSAGYRTEAWKSRRTAGFRFGGRQNSTLSGRFLPVREFDCYRPRLVIHVPPSGEIAIGCSAVKKGFLGRICLS